MMRRVGVVLCLVIAAGACSSGGGGGITPPDTSGTGNPPPPPIFSGLWGPAEPIPQGIQEVHAAVLGSRIYIAGGIGQDDRATSVAFRYDAGTDSWEQIADLPAARHHMPLAVANDTLYAIGGLSTGTTGFAGEDNLWLYSVANDSWETRTSLPRPRGASAVGVIDGQIIVAGGYDDNVQLLDTIAIYNPGTDSWRPGAPMPTPRDHLAGAAWQGIFYTMGGRRVTIETTMATAEAYVFANDSWVPLPDMPTSRGGLSAAASDGRIHVLGGEPDAIMLVAHEAFDIGTGIWWVGPPIPTGRHGLGVAATGGNIYAIGGGPVAGLAQTNVVEVFVPF